MIYTLDQIKSIVKPIAEKYHLPAVYLFGSYARGTASEESDIDLLVDTTGTGLTNYFTIGEVYADLEEAFQKPIDLITVSGLIRVSQKDDGRNFSETVWKEKVDLYGAA